MFNKDMTVLLALKDKYVFCFWSTTAIKQSTYSVFMMGDSDFVDFSHLVEV